MLKYQILSWNQLHSDVDVLIVVYMSEDSMVAQWLSILDLLNLTQEFRLSTPTGCVLSAAQLEWWDQGVPAVITESRAITIIHVCVTNPTTNRQKVSFPNWWSTRRVDCAQACFTHEAQLVWIFWAFRNVLKHFLGIGTVVKGVLGLGLWSLCCAVFPPDIPTTLQVEYAHNSLVSFATGMLPFMAANGLQPPLFPNGMEIIQDNINMFLLITKNNVQNSKQRPEVKRGAERPPASEQLLHQQDPCSATHRGRPRISVRAVLPVVQWLRRKKCSLPKVLFKNSQFLHIILLTAFTLETYLLKRNNVGRKLWFYAQVCNNMTF